MPGIDGIALMTRLMEADPLLEIFFTGNPTVGDARHGLKEGVFDELINPQKVENIATVIRSAAGRRDRREEQLRRARADQTLADRPDSVPPARRDPRLPPGPRRAAGKLLTARPGNS
jgi:DNA-binding NtrC family response regulator